MIEYVGIWWRSLLSPREAAGVIMGADEARRPGFIRFLAALTLALYGFYGVSMGLFRGALPAVVSGVKLPALYALTMLVCLPSFYAFNCLRGPQLTGRQCVRLMLMAVSANAAALASYGLLSYFFTLTALKADYAFLLLMHTAVFAIAGGASLGVILMIFRATYAAKGRTPRYRFLALWALMYGLVGSQMAWLLRPWVGSWSAPYTPFRPIGGTFFEAVFRLLR